MVEDIRSVGIWFGQLGALLGRLRCGRVALNVFDDDDGVVDDEAGGERDAEERKRVDAEAEDLDEGKGADERDRDRDGGNDGGAPVLQEEEDDDDDDDDRFTDRRDDLVDRFADDQGGVDGDDALKPGRIGFLQLSQNGAAALVDVESIGVGELLNANTDGIAAFEAATGKLQAGVVVFRADLGAANVFDEDDSAARWYCFSG